MGGKVGNVSQGKLVELIPERSVNTIEMNLDFILQDGETQSFWKGEMWLGLNFWKNAVGSRRGDEFQETEARGS